ncbi:MAG: hypothetical protein ACRDJW_06545 [Thermomicrobiales bacterium]
MSSTGARATPTTTDWTSLRRPLDLPALAESAACPRTEGERVSRHFDFALGDGPAYASYLGPDGVANFGGAREEGGWFYVKVLWIANPDYSGPMLVRGAQLDGSNELRFENGDDPTEELGLEGGGAVADAPGWRHWPSYTRVRAPGCYAYQVDGQDFSEVIIFQAIEERPEELTPVPKWESGRKPLPRDLNVVSGVRLSSEQVRLALLGPRHLVVRLDVTQTQTEPLNLPGQDRQSLETKAAVVHWAAHPEHGWPTVATWDDDRHRYRLEVLDADPDAWSEEDLVTLVEAFAAAPEPGSEAL